MKSKWRAAARLLYALLAVLLVLCIGLQFYWAGMAVFTEASYWSQHVMFIHIFGFNLPVLLLLAAIGAGHARWAYWHVLLILLLTFLMYFSANISASQSWVGALHPVLGTLLLAAAASNGYRAIKACCSS